MKKKIFVTLSTFAEFDRAPLDLLEQSGFEFSVNASGKRMTPEEVIGQAKDFDAVVAGVEPYDEFVLDNMEKLKCISRCGVGIDSINLDKAKEKGVAIKNTPDVVIQPVAELTVAMIFDLLRKLSYYTALMRSHKWQKAAGNLLSGRKAGVIGLGGIGKRVAEMLSKLDADVYGTDLSPDENWAEKNDVTIVSKEKLLAECDIVTIHVSSGTFIFDKEDIGMMKEGAYLINTSRGRFLDENALHDALKSGHIGGAALDVYSEEPYQGKLCDFDNVVLTPHVATLTKESRACMETEAVQNAINYLNTGK